MKHIVIQSTKREPCNVVLGESADVRAWMRSAGRATDYMTQTSEEAIEDVELRRTNGKLEVRTRAIGTTEWSGWKVVGA